MKSTTHKGKKAEDLAARYLLSKGYSVLRENYRSGRNEIDLIVQIGNEVVAVEVKFRKTNFFGFPELAVDSSKQNRIAVAMENFVEETGISGEVRYDIVSITKDSAHLPEILHFEDAFWPEGNWIGSIGN